MLPYNITINPNFIVKKALCEIAEITEDSITFRPVQQNTEIHLVFNGEEKVLEFDPLDDISISF